MHKSLSRAIARSLVALTAACGPSAGPDAGPNDGSVTRDVLTPRDGAGEDAPTSPVDAAPVDDGDVTLDATMGTDDVPVVTPPDAGSVDVPTVDVPTVDVPVSTGPICRSASTLDIFDERGALDPARYRALARAFATAEAVDYRFGADARTYHPTPESFATIYKPEDHVFRHPPDHPSSLYQLGGPWMEDPGNYNSTAGQVLFVPDALERLGVYAALFVDVSHNVINERPERPWYYDADQRDHGLISREALAMRGNRPYTRPVSLARARTTDEWTQDCIVAFDDGFLMSTGTHSSGGNSNVGLQLPAGLVPTSIALTTNNEFALVTVWDTTNVRGGLAVIALGGPATPGFWGDWRQVYPGLHSYALFSFMKLLGVIDLPGMVAPISVSAAADMRWPLIGAPEAADLNLSVESTRRRFVDGDLRERYARAGYAVVLSRSEKKVLFVDLQPLFQWYAAAYFSTPARFAATRNMGQGPGQFPPTFAEAPDARPTVLATRTFDACPTAITTSVNLFKPFNFVGGNPDHLAYVPRTYTTDTLVGTEDGVVHVFGVAGLRDETAASDAAIREVRSVRVGRNPTSIEPLGLAFHEADHPVDFVVVSRGDRRVDLFRGDPMTGALTTWKTLRDSRLVDPITVADIPSYGNHVPLIVVSDYRGRQVVSYRYDVAHMVFYGNRRIGMGPDGRDEFECGGDLPVPGGALFASGTNEP